jgi:hypothetical protein
MLGVRRFGVGAKNRITIDLSAGRTHADMLIIRRIQCRK